jgi:hypothetical protein
LNTVPVVPEALAVVPNKLNLVPVTNSYFTRFIAVSVPLAALTTWP